MIKKNSIRKCFVKFISVVTAGAFLFTGVYPKAGYASVNFEGTGSGNNTQFNTFIPSSAGKITYAKYYNSDEIIINIQDLHCHPETQKNIAKIIEQINKNYKLDQVYLEGAVGSVDTSLLSSLKKTEFGNQIIESLLNMGRLSGAEYYSVVKDKNKFITGIEDNAIYEENIQLLNKILSVYPQVSTICGQLDSEIKSVKKDYFNKDIRKLERLTYKFKKNKINAKTYYGELEKAANKVNEPLDKYENVKLYLSLLNKMKGINLEKISQQFKTYVTVLRSQIPYKQYVELSGTSNNFANMENISSELLSLSKQYGICDKYNLPQLEEYLECLEFNKNINPINFVKEEKNLISNIYIKLGRTKYEQEVAFLADFIPTIKDYFTANITTEDYYRFKEKFTEFRHIWNSYFSENTAKELDEYAQMLSKYHENNLKRDKIFADVLAPSGVSGGDMQIKGIDLDNILKNKKIKLVITGGFHTKGLEKIFDERKISYIVLTPKVTHTDPGSNNVYLETIQEYVDILNDTVNIRPIEEEPLNISFPKILASAFVELNLNTSLSQEVKIQYINDVIREVSGSKSSGNISLGKCSVDSLSSTDVKISVTYKDKSNNGMESTYEYLLDNSGSIQTYTKVDASKNLDMIARYFGNIKYAAPSVILEISQSARKKINQKVIDVLKTVSGNSISFMPSQKLHIVVAYDSGSEMSETQIDAAVNAKDTTNAVFSDTVKLSSFLTSSKVPLEGKIKLMPDGEVVLEMTNEAMISQIFELRNVLKKTAKYSFPKTVNMTLGRISDKNLFNAESLQSRQQLADLVSKLNNKIYEINKQNELSTIKSNLSLKAGYLSVTGDRDYLVVKVKPSSQTLSILNGLFKNTKSIIYSIYTCFIAPIWEETVFRFIPFAVSGLFVVNTGLILPSLSVLISGMAAFPLIHIATDKINSKIFGVKSNLNVKSLFISSAILTASYLAVSVVFPEMPLLALGVSSVMHSFYNVMSVSGKIKSGVLSIFNGGYSNTDERINSFVSTVRDFLKNSLTKSYGDNKNAAEHINSILNNLENTTSLSEKEKYDLFSKSVNDLFDFIVSFQNSKEYFNFNQLLEAVLISSPDLKDASGMSLFDKAVAFGIAEGRRTGSSRFKAQLLYIAEYFYNTDKTISDKIINVLYENAILPFPSPVNFSSLDKWEDEISSIIEKTKLYEYNYLNFAEFMYPLDKKYAYAVLKAMRKNGYCQTVPYVNFAKGYEWEKEFNESVLGQKDSDDILFGSANIKNESVNTRIIDEYKITLNDIIARFEYVKKNSKYEKTLGIKKQFDEILNKLKAAEGKSKGEKYKIANEQINALLNLFAENVETDSAFIMDVMETLAPLFVSAQSVSGIKSFDNIMNALLLSEKKSFRPDFNSNEKVSYSFKLDFYKAFAKVYPVDKTSALQMLKSLHGEEKGEQPFFSYANWIPENIGDAYKNVPGEISDVIKTYEDLEAFYEAVGIDWDDPSEKSLIYDRYFHTYDYVKIMKMLPAYVIEGIKFLSDKPVYFRHKKSIKTKESERSLKTSDRFMFFNDILENNALALEDLNSADSRAMYASIAFLEKMIADLKQINEQHGNDAYESLNEIKKLFDSKEMTPEFVKEQKSLVSWHEPAIKDIRSLHTLINAVHQTAIADFTKIRDSMNKIDKSGMFIINPGKNQIPVYDFSEHKMKPEVRDFLSKLAEYNFGYYDNNKIMMKDGKLIWSKRLGVHSVDILINFDDINEGIRLSYYDSSRGDGGARRVSILAGVLSSIGFEITSFDNIVDKTGLENIGGVCGVKAVFRVENSLNVGENFAEAFYRVYRLMNRTKNLDYALEGKQDDDNDKGHIYGQYYVPSFTLDDFRRMKGDIKAVSAQINDKTLNEELFALYENTKINSEKTDGMDAVYDYLGISRDKRSIDTVIRMFVDGKIVVNDTGNLEINKQYIPMQSVISAIKEDQNETFRQAQLINLIDYGNMSFVSEGYIGKMVAVEGILRLTDGYLSIKGVVDNERRRMKCAYVEYVDFNGVRRPLKYSELINILNDNGYAVKHQKERSISEKRETIKLLKEKIAVKRQSIEINGRGVSSGNGGYSSGVVTYNKDNIGDDSILIMSYTTPDDVEQISKIKGLITTSGGMLSHANITAREQKKSAVLASGRWEGNKLECTYYTAHGDISKRDGFQIREIEEHNVLLQEGDRIFINGETGDILLFNSINNEDLNILQKEIDKNNTVWIKNFLDEHKNDKNIGMIVEYLYLQSVNNEHLDKVFNMLLSWAENDVVRAKIKELNDKYIEDKLNAVNDALQNIKNIDDPNIAYSVIYRIEKQINSIKSLSKREDIEKTKNEIEAVKKDVKEKLISFIASFKSIILSLNKKESLTAEEKEKSVKLLEMAKVWNYFYGYPGIEQICGELEAKIINDKNAGNVIEQEIETFERITAGDVFKYGTKTTELAKIAKLIKDKHFSGVSVPHGIGISKNVLDIFFEQIGRGAEFKEMMMSFEKAVLSGDREQARRIGKTISDIIQTNDSEKLENYVKSLAVEGKMYAVRSSGVGEDGTSYAFAGMGETSLNVNFTDIYKNIKKSWESFYSYRSIDYMTDSRHIVMPAVLIQEMVPSVAKAGVIFTRDENGNLTEEVVWGLGEGLVSGRINPDHITLSLKDNKITYLRALDNMKKITEIKGGGTAQIRLTRDEQIERVIDESMIRRLSSAAFELEKNSGYPVDIEFAIDGNNEVYILQRRPITTLTVNESFSGIKEEKKGIDQKLVDKLISDLNGITRDRNLETIIKVKNILSNLPENAFDRYEMISDQINILFDIIKEDSSNSSRIYRNYLMQYIMPFIPFVNLRGTDESVLNYILNLLPVEQENEYLDIIRVCGDMIKQIYPISRSKATDIIRFLQQRNIVSYKNIPYSIKDALSEYKYEGLKSYYITVSEPGADPELKELLDSVIEKFKKMKLSDSDAAEKMDSYLKEFYFLSDKINVSTLPLLEYQLNSAMNDLALNTSLSAEERTLILDGILSLCEQITAKNEALDKNILTKINKIALESYNITRNMKAFDRIISFLLFAAEKTDNIDRSETNGLAVEYLSKIALNIYEPVKKDSGEKKEYAERERVCLDIFTRLSEASPRNMSVYRFLFNTNQYENVEGINLSDKTFGILFNAVKKNKLANVVCQVPYKDSDIIYSDKLVDMFASLTDNLNIVRTYGNLYESGDNGAKIVLGVIKKLYATAGNTVLSAEERKKAVFALAALASSSLYSRINDGKILDSEKINESIKALGISSFLKPAEAYISNIFGSSRYSRADAKDVYEFTSLIKYLPDEVLNGAEIVQKPPVYLKTDGETNMSDENVRKLVERFDTLQEILNYNVLALGMFENLNQSMSEKDFNNIVDCLKKMIDGFIKIDEIHGRQAQHALENILSSMEKINEDSIRKQTVISKWDFDTIGEIKEIHTLINAVHQTSIYDFKKSIGDVGVANRHIKTITATQDNTSILAYDLSDNKINKDIVSLISTLATKKLPDPVGGSGRYKIEDFMCKDDILVWTTRLFVHSVDVFMNFGDSDRGITIYYHEGGRNTGNAERVRYFKTILEKFGFNVEADMKVDYGSSSGVCGLKAVLNKDYGLNDTTDMVDVASKVILLFKYSNMLDWDLGELYDQYSYNSYLQTFDNLVEKFMDGEIWVGYAPTPTDCFGEKGQNMTKRIEKPRGNMVQFYNSVLSYLGLEKIPSREKGYNIEQPKIDKYFNKTIERAYIEGRIIIDENGKLRKNENYDIMPSIMTDISNNISETSKQSRIVNLLNRYEFSYRTLGYVGSLIAVTGVMKLVNGDKLFVKGVMNPYTRRMKYAMVELVTDNGHRKLTSDELISLLSGEGYDISNQEWVGTRERQMIKNLLERKIQSIDSPEVRCTSTSDGNGIYVAGNITFDRKNVKEDNILVVPYTTPDDVEAIKTSKGIITTGGGILSHAAITTREFKKPSVVVNGAAWVDNEAEIQYFLSEGDIETVNGFQLQKIKAKNLLLKEGFRVLMNGETGTVLLFNDIDTKLLDELQECIRKNDERLIIDFMKKNEDNKDIRRLVEYIYFQSIGNSNLKQVLFALFSNEMPESVRAKIKELNQGYIQDKIRNITEGMENVKSIDNVNIAYGIIEMLSKKFELIKTTEKIDDLEKLKEEILSLEKEIKDRLYIYLNLLISDARMYLEKEKLGINDIRKIINIINTATVYDFFVPESEERADLKSMSRELKQLLALLDIKTKGYLMKDEVVGVNKEITTFDGIHEEDVNKFGSKTTELAKMYRLLKDEKGVYVPEGMGVSIDVLELLFNLVGRDGDSKILKDFEKAVKDKDNAAAAAIAEKILNLIDEKDVSPSRLEFENFLKNKISEFAVSGVKYSVRSSGVGEDGSSNAFAGMGETKLNVSAENVYENIKECWKSFFSERCISYMIKSGQVVKPAVLIQEMVNVEKAGVVFSRNKYGNETIEVVYGLGEGLVSGALTPDTINVDINNGEIIEYSVADKQFKIVPTEDGTAKEAVKQGVKARALNAETVKRLTEIIRILEKDSGYPIDVEFGIKDGNIYILQRRAITTFDTSSKKNGKDKKAFVKPDLKQLITVVSGDVSAESEVFVNIANPENTDEAISVYLKKADEGRSVFIVDGKYGSLIKDGRIISLLIERINSDPVVMKKFNANLSVFSRVDNGEIGILPVSDLIDNAVLEKSININVESVRNILSAA